MYELEKDIRNKLFEYQIENTQNIIRILKNNKSVLDASDTGTGKTYTAIAACSHLGLRPFVVCPKSVIYAWRRVCDDFKVKPISITNYESLRMGKYYTTSGRKVKCPYLIIDEVEIKEKTLTNFIWKVPTDCVIIFDEVHKCSNMSALNGRLLISAKYSNSLIMCLSATIADTPIKFRIFFYILNFMDPSQHNKEFNFAQFFHHVDRWIERDRNPMVRIHHLLYPKRATRMRIDVLGDLFPETQIIGTPYTMGNKTETKISTQYKIISDELTKLKDKSEKDKGNILVKVMRAHQKIEMLKVPTFVELTKDFFENGFSVVIFVNYTQTLELLSSMLKSDCLIYGNQKGFDRERNIQDFQINKERLIICNIKAGGVGISLHDIHGGHPRVSLLSPTWSSIDLSQALGRIHRAGGKTKSLQRIIYTASTIEERIADKLKRKLLDINSINNGDLDLTNIEFDYETREL
jgi:superfamily II DNA or RNA helicase